MVGHTSTFGLSFCAEPYDADRRLNPWAEGQLLDTGTKARMKPVTSDLPWVHMERATAEMSVGEEAVGRHRFQVLPLACITVIVGSSTFAAAPPATEVRGLSALEQRFQQLDRDGDGRLSVQESRRVELHRRMDRDGDGSVTLGEVRVYLRRRRARRAPPTAPPTTITDLPAANAPPGPPAAAPPVSSSRAFTDLRFSKDYFPGKRDAHGQYMAGTETIRLLQHKGMLFASTGVWMDVPYGQSKGDQPWAGPQILVKESANGPWRVDVSFPHAVRVDAMISATFVTDGSGRKLHGPVNVLVASPSSKDTATWTRNDDSGRWTESMVVAGLRGGLRSFCTHRDSRTGVQYLFGGSTKSGSIFRAVYDPSAPGKLRWHPEPELSGTGRVMCMAEANGVLYAACGIKDETPLSGGLFRRVDGRKPRWKLLWRWPHVIREQGDESEILRGLTAIPDPKGGKHEVLLGACNYPGVVYRINPMEDHAVRTELDIRAYFAKAFGVRELRGPCLTAYNNFLPVGQPDTGERVHLLGVWINYPSGRGTEPRSSAWYLIRHADGTYGHGRVFDPKHPRPNPPRGLLATRTIEVSPFPQDEGRVLYFGGFDCARRESHNTAWIYRAKLSPPTAGVSPSGPAQGGN